MIEIDQKIVRFQVLQNDIDHVHMIEKKIKKPNGNASFTYLYIKLSDYIIYRSHRRSTSESSNDAREDSTSTTGISRITSITELNDLTVRKKAEVDRLAELERERIQLL